MQFDLDGNNLLILPESPADAEKLDQVMEKYYPLQHSISRLSDKEGQSWRGKYYLEVYCGTGMAAAIKRRLEE